MIKKTDLMILSLCLFLLLPYGSIVFFLPSAVDFGPSRQHHIPENISVFIKFNVKIS